MLQDLLNQWGRQMNVIMAQMEIKPHINKHGIFLVPMNHQFTNSINRAAFFGEMNFYSLSVHSSRMFFGWSKKIFGIHNAEVWV